MFNRRSFLKNTLFATILLTLPSLLWAEETKLLFTPQQELSFNKPVQRILSAGRVSDVLLMALAPEKLVGSATDMKDPRKQHLSHTIRTIPYVGRFSGKASTLPMEKLIALAPDIIIDVGDVSQTYLSTAEKVYQQTQIPYVLVAGRLKDTPQQLLQVGELLSVQERAKALADHAKHILDLTHHIAGGHKTRIYVGRSADGLETGLLGSIHTEVLDWVGAENVASMTGEKLLTRISMEQLFLWQPEVILTQDKNFYQLLPESALWQKLSAVKNKQFFLAPDEPFGWFDAPPSINRLLGCLWLAHLIAPEKLPQQQFEQEVSQFLRLFYDYDEQAISALLNKLKR
ncbi:ABC transporter substrate-binding protein [Pasteurellaceae bacterium 22721_9_1]